MKLRLENYLDAIAQEQDKLTPLLRDIVQERLGDIECGSLEKARSDGWRLDVADVVDADSGRLLYHLALWPYGDGVLVRADTGEHVGWFAQETFQTAGPMGNDFVDSFHAAFVEGCARLEIPHSPGDYAFPPDINT